MAEDMIKNPTSATPAKGAAKKPASPKKAGVAKPKPAPGKPAAKKAPVKKAPAKKAPPKVPPKKRFADSTFGHKLYYGLPMRLGHGMLKMGMPWAALGLMRIPRKHYGDDPRTLHLREQAHRARGAEDMAVICEVTRLRQRIHVHVKARNYPALLRMMAALERTTQAAPFAAGKMISSQLVSEKGRARILKAALKARERFEGSAFLLHLITLCEGMNGEYKDANAKLVEQIKVVGEGDDDLTRMRFKLLQTSWRVVDLAAREQMDWADSTGGYRTLFGEDRAAEAPATPEAAAPAERPKPSKILNGTTKPDTETHIKLKSASKKKADPGEVAKVASAAAEALPKLGVSFKEHALQGRMRAEYLRACDEELYSATALGPKLQVLREMTRPGVRHIPHYGASYAQAEKRMLEHADEFDWLFGPEAATKETVAQSVMDLCAYLHLSCKLKHDALSARIIARLDALSARDDLCFGLWPAPAAILREADDQDTADRIMARVNTAPPRINRDMQNYFDWAMITRRYSEAEAFYNTLPKKLHRKSGLLYYVNILQRRGRFSEALRLLQDVHGQVLANPVRVNAYTNYSLIKRTGELRFLIETARIYKSVPQPKKPKGVVLIAPRNIDHLRRYPLMVLLEFKRKGWAVVPMVEGLLPREQTGVAEIDVMNSAISPNIHLHERAQAVMPEVRDFVCAPETGTLKWGEMDLSHALWEDAAINRRRYSIDWSCPALQTYMTSLGDWTRVMGRVMDYARSQHQKTGLPTACVSLFSYRLPDAMFRFYCQQFGDADKFFYLHTANGYQNYFTNFSTNVSQRLVMRNMTRYPHVRSGSFPLPEFFEAYVRENRPRLPEVMERFAPITKVKRSTEGERARAPEAEALDARIADWREKGGKIACAFGKVVCDSGVPFDGGPAHASMKDWINHAIKTVQGTNTLLLIKPHPHEINNQIATFPTEYFADLLEEPLGENAVLMGHRWFDMHDMKARMDLGLIYNGTTAIELGLMGIPALLAGHFAPVDYPIGHVIARNRAAFESYLRFERPVRVPADLAERAALWLDYMANEDFTQGYRYHARPVTNKVLYPPYWFAEDLKAHGPGKDPAVQELVGRALGLRLEPGGEAAALRASGLSGLLTRLRSYFKKERHI